MFALPLVYKLGIGAALALLVAAGGWWLHNKVWQAGYSQAVAEYIVAELEAIKAARVREQEMQRQSEEAMKNAKHREIKLKADARLANAAADGLQNDLAAIRSQLPLIAEAAVRKYADAASVVFDQCVRKYTDVAEDADGLASDRQTLIEAWPK